MSNLGDYIYRKHVFLTGVMATVGQIRKDLKEIVKLAPDHNLTYMDENSNDCYITRIKEWKGLVLLQVTRDEGEAIIVEDLLDGLAEFSEDTEVLLQDGWELRDLRPNLESGKCFWYDNDWEGICFEVVENDIRLFRADELMYEVEKLVSEYPDRRVVCLGEDGKVYRVIEPYDDDGMNYIPITDGDAGDDIHVSDLEGCFSCFGLGGVVVIQNRKGTVFYQAISETDGGIFFNHKVGDEDVIAFRLGSILYCNEWYDIDDDELFSDDDVIIKPER